MYDCFDSLFFSNMERNIKKFHSLFKYNKLSGIFLEEIISNSLQHIKHEWTCNSHKSKYDINILRDDKDFTISVKSGMLKNNILTLSSFRTTKYKTLKGKLKFINNHHSDIILSVPYVDDIYYMFVLPKSILKTDKTWTKVGNNYYLKDNKVDMRIMHSMSDQLWYKIHLDNVDIKHIWKMKI